jgi:hypothetical protein
MNVIAVTCYGSSSLSLAKSIGKKRQYSLQQNNGRKDVVSSNAQAKYRTVKINFIVPSQSLGFMGNKLAL